MSSMTLFAIIFFGVIGLIALGVWLVLRWIKHVRETALSSDKCVVYIEIGSNTEKGYGRRLSGKPTVKNFQPAGDEGKRFQAITEDGGFLYSYRWRNQIHYVIIPKTYKWTWIEGMRKIRLAHPGDLIAAEWGEHAPEHQMSEDAARKILFSHLANDVVGNVTGSGFKLTTTMIVIFVVVAIAGVFLVKQFTDKKAPASQPQPAATSQAPKTDSGVIVIK